MLELNKVYNISLANKLNYNGKEYTELKETTLIADKDDQWVFTVIVDNIIREIPVMKSQVCAYYEKQNTKTYWYKDPTGAYSKIELTANELKLNKKAKIKFYSFNEVEALALEESKTGKRVIYELETPYVYITGTRPVYSYKVIIENGKKRYLRDTDETK